MQNPDCSQSQLLGTFLLKNNIPSSVGMARKVAIGTRLETMDSVQFRLHDHDLNYDWTPTAIYLHVYSPAE